MVESPIYMTAIITRFIKLGIFLLCFTGFAIIVKNRFEKENSKTEEIALNSKALQLKNYLLKYQKPQRVELTGLSNRYAREIKDIKKLKISQDPQSDFYVTIQLFSDESDASAPLIAQIRFIDLKSGNAKKEESINLQ